jgi:hypothetical protein
VTVIATGFPSARRPRARLAAATARAGAPGRGVPAAEPSDASLLQGLNDADRWTKPAYLRFKVRKLR